MPKTRTKPSAVRKKKFQGNQFTAEQDMDFVSSSAKKIKACNYDDVILDPNSSYVICNFFLIFNALSEFLVCKSCAGNVKFRRTAGAGVGFKLIVDCSCNTRQIPSSPMSGKVYEINQRLMFVFRILGCGLQSLNIFCSLLDITHSFSNAMYYAVIEKIYIAAKATFEVIQKKAVSEEVEANAAAGNEPRHLSVSGDGSWKKRGFSSLFGIVSLIGKYTGKVVDVSVRSAYCQSCAYWALRQGTPEYDEWRAVHDETCTANHTGSAGKMEVDCVKDMFLRSEEQLGVKYKYYIGDGDSETFKTLLDTDPYDDLTVTKESVGHNSTVWRMVPKHQHIGSKIIAIATYVAAGLFNEGRSSLLKILNALGVSVGMEAGRYASQADTSRILAAERKLSAAARNARIAQRIQENVHLDIYEIEENPFYGAGIAD